MLQQFLARDAFINVAIAMMFVRLFVCLSETRVHCDHTVHFNMDLSLWLDDILGMISQERLKIEVKLLLSTNRKSYYATSIGTTMDNLE